MSPGRSFAACVALALAAGVAGAASLVPPRDLGALARHSSATVLARALDNRTARHGSLLFTVTRFAVARVVAGPVGAGDVIVVEAPGGELDGVGWVVPGAPRFTTGHTYLLFLASRPDGTWTPQMLAYGLLELIRGRNGTGLLAPLAEQHGNILVPRPDGVEAEPVGVYREGDLLDHLRAVALGARWNAATVLASDAEVPLGVAALAAPSGCAFSSGQDHDLRWAKFDSGQSVQLSAESGGDASLNGGGFAEVEQALAMWNAIPATSLDLGYAGKLVYSMACTSEQDTPAYGVNVVVFNDPCDDIPDLSGCSGTLAFGGPWYSGTHQFDGKVWSTIRSWFVVVNNDLGWCIGSTYYSRMLAHELGHGLGFDHVDDSRALMYENCCNAVNETDTACAQYLYPEAGGTPPPAPTNLQASDGSYSDRIRMTWNGSAGATGYEVLRNTTNSTATAGSVGSTTATGFADVAVAPGTTYWYWVRASNASGASGYSAPDTGFAAECRVPQGFALMAPAAGSALPPDSTSVTLSWQAADGASSYDLYLGAGDTPALAGMGIGTTSTTAPVVPGAVYHWRVVAHASCDASRVTSSATWSFEVPGAQDQDAQWVAVVAHNQGLGGSAWRSDLAIANVSDDAIDLELRYRPSGAAETVSRTLRLAARVTTWLPDVVAGFLGQGDGRGSLRLVPGQAAPSPSVFARTYSAGESGGLGQGVPALTPSGDQTTFLTGLLQGAVDRTNVGVTAGSADVTALFEALQADGTGAGEATRTVVAGDQQQWPLNALFPALEENGAPVTVRVTLAGAAIPYASVADQTSQDAVFVQSQRAATAWLVPVAAHTGGRNRTFWRTDVYLHNPTSDTITVAAEYLPAGADNGAGGTSTVAAVLPPGATALVSDIVRTLFGLEDGKGALQLTAGGAGFVAASRTYTTRSAGGTLGQGVAAVPLAAIAGATRTLGGVRTSEGTRTNLGLVSLNARASVELVLRDADGTVLATRHGLEVPPRSLVQLAIADAFPGAPAPDPVGSVEVHPDAPLIAYLSVVDGVSQDPVFVVAY